MSLSNKIAFDLMNFVKQPNDILIPNFYYNKFEMDLFRLMPSGYLVEYEIKISKADFKKDFEKTNIYFSKDCKHKLIADKKHANRFFFVVPENLIHISEVPEYSGLIYYIAKDWPKFKVVKPAKLIHKNIFPESKYKVLAQSLSFRESNLRYKLNRVNKLWE